MISIHSVVIRNTRVLLLITESGKSSGPDGVSPINFKQISDSLVLPLSLLFESFMSTSSVPNEWRAAHVVPVFKFCSSA